MRNFTLKHLTLILDTFTIGTGVIIGIWFFLATSEFIHNQIQIQAEEQSRIEHLQMIDRHLDWILSGNDIQYASIEDALSDQDGGSVSN